MKGWGAIVGSGAVDPAAGLASRCRCRPRVGGASRSVRLGAAEIRDHLPERCAGPRARGNAGPAGLGYYAFTAGEEDHDRLNHSSIHIDFMIGSDDVAVTGIGDDGTETPVLRDGAWKI